MSDETRDRLARVLGPAGPEVSCETCFEMLDSYVELEHLEARLAGHLGAGRTEHAGEAVSRLVAHSVSPSTGCRP